METMVSVPDKEHQLRILIAQLENKCVRQRVQYIGKPWIVLDKAEELKRIIEQKPKPNPKINFYEGD